MSALLLLGDDEEAIRLAAVWPRVPATMLPDRLSQVGPEWLIPGMEGRDAAAEDALFHYWGMLAGVDEEVAARKGVSLMLSGLVLLDGTVPPDVDVYLKAALGAKLGAMRGRASGGRKART